MMATYGQNGRVGVNTSKPATSFDIAGMKDSSGNSLPTDMTGLQAPRLTRTELTAIVWSFADGCIGVHH